MNVAEVTSGTTTAPVPGSGCWPAWMARVAKRRGSFRGGGSGVGKGADSTGGPVR